MIMAIPRYMSPVIMLDSKSISEYQSESGSDLEDDMFSVTEDIEILSEYDDGEYFWQLKVMRMF